MNANGQTAYEEASSDKIRRLFYRLRQDKYRFSSNEDAANPLKMMKGARSTTCKWLDHYPNNFTVRQDVYSETFNKQYDNSNAMINVLKSLIGMDPYKKKIQQWSANIQALIDKTFTFPQPDYFHACKLLEDFTKNRNIEFLFHLYALNSNFCQYLGKSLQYTDYFYTPIHVYLYTVEYRSYKGRAYRGLTMSKTDLNDYKYALHCKESYIRTNTFCSTSMIESVAEMFAESGNLQGDKLKVLMVFDFEHSCSTAIILQEIKEDNESPLARVHLKHYHTDEIRAEINRDRLEDHINNMLD